MVALSESLSGLARILKKSIKAYGLPGASVAVLHDGEIVEAAAGVLSTATGVEVTTDSLFQIGSITKVYTATLVMQLVDAGLVDLDKPVVAYLPKFRVRSRAATKAITVRHLLNHTAGFDGGDHFLDTGRGDDCVDLYAHGLADLAQICAPGKRFSYNNAAFTVLGRLIEVVTGQVWDTALRDRLLTPAGLNQTFTLPEDVIRYRVAVGHQAGTDGIAPVKRWDMDRSAGPAGVICASAGDVVRFASLHIDNGKAVTGKRVLAAGSAKAMQRTTIEMNESGNAIGLGWMLSAMGKLRVISHNGGTIGQAAFLAVVPKHRFAVCVLTNGPTGPLVWRDVATLAFERVLGLPMPAPEDRTPAMADAEPHLDLSKYEGEYVRRAINTKVRADGDKLVAEMTYVDVPYDLTPPPPMELTPIDAETFALVGPDGQAAMGVWFLDADRTGRPQLLYVGGRLARRQ